MKKAATIFLSLLILASATGTTIALHYCGKSLQDVAVFGQAQPCCKGMEMPKGCCHEEEILIASDDYQPVQLMANAGFAPVLLSEISFPELDFSLQFRNSSSKTIFFHQSDHPPAGSDIIIRSHSFLI